MSSGARLPAWTGAIVTALSMCACEGSGGSLGPTVELVAPDGANAAAGVVEGELRVEVVQDGRLVDCDGGCETRIDNESFELTLPIRSLEARTSLHAFIDDAPDGPIWGATPPFEPYGEGLTTLRVVMARPSRCSPLTLSGLQSDGRPRLVRPRRDLAVAVRRNIVVMLGGVEADAAASDRVGRFDQAAVETIPALPATSRPAGAARGLALSEDDSVFVADGGFWRFSLNESRDGTGQPIVREEYALHEGASGASALVDLSDGAVVLGGTDTAGITWLDERGVPNGETTALSVPRSHPAAVALGGGVLVVGGASEGEPVAEWVEPGADGAPLDGLELPAGRGGWLVPSPHGEAALWIGWTAPDGAPGEEAYLVRGCPGACEVATLTWPRPRAGAAGASTAAGAFWIAGGRTDDGLSRDVDIVSWTGEEPSIVEGPELEVPRAGAAAFEHASGIVTVAGGEGPEGLLDDLEHCAPAGLDPL